MMRLPRFRYHAPRELGEAARILSGEGPRAMLLAGGTDLMVQLAADVADPPAAVLDLSHIAELKGISTDGYDVAIGTLTTYTELRHSPVISARLHALAEAAATVGAAQIQNRGTIGGSMAQADPAAEYPAVALVLDAQLHAVGPSGQRVIEARDFFVSYLTTALGPAEVLTETRNAQPAILAHSVPVALALRQQGILPSVVAGHSLGEFSAAVAAGALDPADGLRIVLQPLSADDRETPAGDPLEFPAAELSDDGEFSVELDEAGSRLGAGARRGKAKDRQR